MPSVIDTLITKFVMDPSSYQKGARDIVKATEDVARDIGRGFSNVARNVATGGAIIATGFLAFGRSAIKSAVDFDALTRSLTAVTKSAARAKEILAFGDKLALPSIFEAKDLDQASLTLEAFGLRTERFLPIAEKLGTIFGGTKDSLMEFVDALGMISSGRTGRGFESLARAGISREQLSLKFGLKFDKGGEFQGDVKQALSAIEREVNDRFGKLSQEMANSPKATLASLGDYANVAMRHIGDSFLKVVDPALKRLTERLFQLNQSGVLTSIADKFVAMFPPQQVGDFLVRTLDRVVQFLQAIPGWLSQNRERFVQMWAAASDFGSSIARNIIPVLTTFLGIAQSLLNTFNKMPDWIRNTVAQFVILQKLTGGAFGSAVGGVIKIGAGILGRGTEIGLLEQIAINTGLMAGGAGAGAASGFSGALVSSIGTLALFAATVAAATYAVNSIAAAIQSVEDEKRYTEEWAANPELAWQRRREGARRKFTKVHGRAPTDDEWYGSLDPNDPIHKQWLDKKNKRGKYAHDVPPVTSIGGAPIAGTPGAPGSTPTGGGWSIGPNGKIIAPPQGGIVTDALKNIGLGDSASGLKPILERIAVNTQKQVDLNKQLFGGGHLSNVAVSEQHLQQVTGRGGRVGKAVDNLVDAIRRELVQVQATGNKRMRQVGA